MALETRQGCTGFLNPFEGEGLGQSGEKCGVVGATERRKLQVDRRCWQIMVGLTVTPLLTLAGGMPG